MGREGPKATPPLAAFRTGIDDFPMHGPGAAAWGLALWPWPGAWHLQLEPCPSEELLCQDWIWARHLTGTQLGKTTYHLHTSPCAQSFLVREAVETVLSLLS